MSKTGDSPAIDESRHLFGEDEPSLTFADVRALEDEVALLRDTVVDTAMNRRFGEFGTTSAAIYGPKGIGRRRLVRALAGEICAHTFSFARVSTLDIRGHSCAEVLTSILDDAREQAPVVILFDCFADLSCDTPFKEIREAVDEYRASDQEVILLADIPTGSLYREDVADLVRAFDVRVELEALDIDRRQAVLEDCFDRAVTAGLIESTDNMDIRRLAARTEGFGEDELERAVRRSVQRLCHSHTDVPLAVDTADLVPIFERVDEERVASARARGAIEDIDTGAVDFGDVGGLADAKDRLRDLLEVPQQWGDTFDAFDLPTTGGILLHGPPGNGKTLLARAVANEMDHTFISVSAPKLKNKYGHGVGSNLGDIFERAERNAPSVVFFDEFDAIAQQRGRDSTQDDITSAVLTELDGVSQTENIVVIAATNRPESLDKAMTRPGRFEYQIPVSRPDEDAQRAIFAIHTDPLPLSEDVTPEWLCSLADDSLSGADIALLCRRAARVCLREMPTDTQLEDIELTRADFRAATDQVTERGVDR